jgi:hypothetical protein
VHTHLLTIEAETVRKRYVSWRNGEAEREWTGLTALARHAPGLAPEPISRGTDDGAPVVVMSRVPGEPLGSARLTPAQGEALAAAALRLFSVPVDVGLRERAYGPSTMRASRGSGRRRGATSARVSTRHSSGPPWTGCGSGSPLTTRRTIA